MAARYFESAITATPGAGTDPLDVALVETFTAIPSRVAPPVEELAFNRALEAIWQGFDAANKYIVATAPFTLAKDADKLPRVAQILANLVEGPRVVADTPPMSKQTIRPAATKQSEWNGWNRSAISAFCLF